MRLPLASTLYSYDFVRRSLPADARSVLEIGCGAGALAVLLQDDGLSVKAIDNDPLAVEQARLAGVAAELRDWPSAIGGQFDAVLFTRSIHHIHDLAGAVTEARRALNPAGRVIVEDFRAEGGSERSNGWFNQLAQDLDHEGALAEKVELDPAEAHDLHSSDAIAEALSTFTTVEREDAAYYFRYLERQLRRPADAEAQLVQELALIESGAIDALGKRFVAFDS